MAGEHSTGRCVTNALISEQLEVTGNRSRLLKLLRQATEVPRA